VVGGSSAVNTCIGLRGTPEDYEGWAAMGLTGWGFEDCLPAFRAIERDVDFADATGKIFKVTFFDFMLTRARDYEAGVREGFQRGVRHAREQLEPVARIRFTDDLRDEVGQRRRTDVFVVDRLEQALEIQRARREEHRRVVAQAARAVVGELDPGDVQLRARRRAFALARH
jgi:choline dehydrogenase-like flavoprotein